MLVLKVELHSELSLERLKSFRGSSENCQRIGQRLSIAKIEYTIDRAGPEIEVVPVKQVERLEDQFQSAFSDIKCFGASHVDLEERTAAQEIAWQIARTIRWWK